jgi:hypothetical protein
MPLMGATASVPDAAISRSIGLGAAARADDARRSIIIRKIAAIACYLTAMIRFICDLGIGLATAVASAVAFFFREPGAGLRARNRPCGSVVQFPANSLLDAVAGKTFSLPAEPATYHKRLITPAIIGKTRPIAALKQKFSLISGKTSSVPSSAARYLSSHKSSKREPL